MEVVSGGVPVVEVAEGYGVSRKSVHAWLHRDVEQPVGVARIGGGGSLDRTFAKVAVLEGRHGI